MLLLAVEVLLGAAILVIDNVLWDYGRLHAYGLLGFTGLNLALAVLVFLKPGRGSLLAALLSVLELGILVANLFVGAQFGVMGFTQEELRDYLLGIASTTHVSTMFGFYRLSRYAYDILLLVLLLTVAVGLATYRRYRRGPVKV